MNGNVSVKANKINVSRIVYALVTKDTKTEFQHGEIKEFGKAMEIQLTPSLATGLIFGNGAKEEDLAKLTGIDVQVNINKIAIEVRTEIMGNKYENGVLSENKADQAKDIALGIEVEETGNNKELIWLLIGAVKPFGNTVKQSESNITFSTDTMNIGFKPRQIDGDIRKIGDTANPDFTNAMANIFLDSIPGNTNEITEKVATPTATPLAGEIASGATVILSSPTPGTSIYYTVDNSVPTAGSTLYSTPIVLTEAITIKAIAYKSGMNPSDILTSAYTITV